MCGRGRCTLRADDIPRACYVTTSNNDNNPVQNLQMDRRKHGGVVRLWVCPCHARCAGSIILDPGYYVPVVRRADGSDGVVVHCMKWGLIPSFTKNDEKPDHYRMFNARSESISEKASFRRLIPKSRCLVAMEGFYEWKKDGSKKHPYYIHFKDGRPFVFAALYDSWKNPEGEILYTFTILTTSASSSLQWLHDRMPVIFGAKESADAWLNGSSSTKFDTLLKPYEQPDLVWYAVTPAMGKPSFDGPECIEQIKLKTEETPSISKFFPKKGGHTLKSEDKSLSDEENIINPPPPTPNDGSGTVEEAKPTSLTKMQCDVKPSHEGSAKKQVKREHEDISADSKSKGNEVKNSEASPHPARKKGKVKEIGDKQPTLFSYFGES